MNYRYLVILLGLLVGACVDQPGAIVCQTGIVCPDGTTCAAAQPVCIVGNCGNGRVDNGEACDDGNILSGDGCSPSCGSESCGNGDVEPGERCDDNNTANGDGCSADCLSLEVCGNGIVDVKSGGTTSEKCDDGNTIVGDGCRADCKSLEFCGNNLPDPGEVCDDGMPTGGPCSPDCQSGLGCGNGFLDPGEQCDDGNTSDIDDCRFPSCKHAVCGDGVIDSLGIRLEQCDGGTTGTPTETAACNIDCTNSVCGDAKVNQTDDEECDNGTVNDSATCDNDCTIPICGDAHVNASVSPAEMCDPGVIGGDSATCDSDCTPPSCGDSHINKSFTPPGGTVPEGCDDGGTSNGDGCSNVCRIESCGNGVEEAVNGEECDDGNNTDTDACRNNCQDPRCGDGVESASEVCDDNGNSSMCDANCSLPSCGDGFVNNQFTPPGGSGVEQCDDGAMANGDGCSSTCRFEPFALAVTRAGSAAMTSSITSNDNPMTISCGSDCSEIYLPNTMVTITANPALNATFNGWSGGGCTGTAPCAITMNASKNVTATFELNTLTITKTGTGGGTVSGPSINCDANNTDCSEVYNVGTAITLMASPNSTSIFGMWTGSATSCGMNPSCMLTINQAQTATAIFTLNTFDLTVATNGGVGTGSVSSSPAGIACPGTCTAGFTANTLVTLVPIASAGSTFNSWSGACTGSGNCAVTMNMAKSVTARFDVAPVVLTVTTSTGGKVTASGIDCGAGSSDCSETYASGTLVTILPDASSGKAFTGWGGACTGTGACSFNITQASTVSATFETNRLTVDRTGGGTGTVNGPVGVNNGINCGGNCAEDYNDFLETAATTTLTATPASGDIFTGWSGGGCSGTGNCVLQMRGPVTVSANFEDASTLTVSLAGTGGGTVMGGPINCPGTCVGDVVDNSMVVITAAADGNSVFSGWTNCDSVNGNQCTMNMTTDKTVTATFDPIQFALQVNVSGAGSGDIDSSPAGIVNCTATTGTCNADFNSGSTVTLTATNPGAVAWSGDCSSCAANTSCMVSMTQARTCGVALSP